MNQLSRVAAYIWPYRKRVFLSLICATVISSLWSMNLSITFPVVEVLFEGDSLHASVDQEIDELNETINGYSTYLSTLGDEQLNERARVQGKLNEASQELLYKQWLKDRVLPYVPADRFQTVLAMLVIVVVSTAVKGLFVYWQEQLVGGVVHASANDMRTAAFSNAMNLDYQSLTDLGTSTLTSRMTNDVTEMSHGLRLSCIQLVREPLKAIGCIVAALLFNWRLTLVAIVVLPLIGLLFYRSGQVLRRSARHMMETMSNIYQNVAETFDATRIRIAFGGGPRHREQLVEANKQYYDHSMKLIRVSSLIRPTTELLGILAFTAVLIPGAYMVLNNTNEIGGVKLAAGPLGIAELSALYVLLAGVLDPLRKLSGVFPQLKRSLAAADRLFEVIDRETEVPEPETPVTIPRHSKEISFENISFRYRHSDSDVDSNRLILQNVNLKIPFGEVVAVVGGNGSGKSTLISLLPRLFDPINGSVKLDGHDIRRMGLKDLRSQIGLVTQDTMLFDETIFDNVRYGNPDASSSQVEQAIQQAHAEEFVSLLPKGLNTKAGLKGQKLSGGQKQRISLARAIVRDPAILIMDEATSAIDAESEAIIYDVLQEFAKGRTVFIITHLINRSFLDIIDRVVVLEHGRVIANGKHDDLIGSCPEYARLVQSDSKTRNAA